MDIKRRSLGERAAGARFVWHVYSMTERSPVPEWLLVRVADQLRVLGHIVRLQLMESLADRARTPQELANALTLSQQNASKHLQVLYTAGLVTRRRQGGRVLYGLADSVVLEVLEDMAARVSMQLTELSAAAEGVDDRERTQLI